MRLGRQWRKIGLFCRLGLVRFGKVGHGGVRFGMVGRGEVWSGKGANGSEGRHKCRSSEAGFPTAPTSNA